MDHLVEATLLKTSTVLRVLKLNHEESTLNINVDCLGKESVELDGKENIVEYAFFVKCTTTVVLLVRDGELQPIKYTFDVRLNDPLVEKVSKFGDLSVVVHDSDRELEEIEFDPCMFNTIPKDIVYTDCRDSYSSLCEHYDYDYCVACSGVLGLRDLHLLLKDKVTLNLKDKKISNIKEELVSLDKEDLNSLSYKIWTKYRNSSIEDRKLMLDYYGKLFPIIRLQAIEKVMKEFIDTPS